MDTKREWDINRQKIDNKRQQQTTDNNRQQETT